ncbi:MAG: UTRA domain-containing protein [Roseovarius sp.]|nr:UTRA domain-containing protein [Roseovarius sp.]
MTRGARIGGWQAVQAEVLRRIHAREWPPGHVIPGEVALAREFGCARATVNRALQALADTGILERRRKAGTRVALHPVSRATLDIPVIRQEIEARGQTYGYRLLAREEQAPEGWARTVMHHAGAAGGCLHVEALHSADGVPFVLENRWISLSTVPGAAERDFATVSANEWLLATAPYTHGDIRFSAGTADADTARLLDCAVGAPVFVVNRVTWDHDAPITAVRLSYAPGYSVETRIGTLS